MNGDFLVGEWLVRPSLNLIESQGRLIHLEPKIMEVLVYLVRHQKEVVSKERLVSEIWADTFVTDQVLNNAIWKLREAFQDDAKNPRFIETIPKKGYRFIGPVFEEVDSVQESGDSARTKPAFVLRSHLAGGRRQVALATLAVALLLSVAILATMNFWPGGDQPKTPVTPFERRDWLLMAQFENRSGDPLLDGTVAYALEQEISNSQFVNIVPRERIQDTLQLMKKALDSNIDPVLGREICLRDAGIRALLTGRSEKISGTYVLTVQLVDPLTAATIASRSEQAANQTELLAAIRRLSNWGRERLGETLPEMGVKGQTLEKATTPSLKALQFYSRAVAPKSYSGETQGALLSSAGHVYLAMGKVKAAEELFQNDLDLAVAAFAKGDPQSLRRRLQSYLKSMNKPTQLGPVVVLLLARSGLVVEARKALSVLEKQGFPEGFVKVVQGELALAQGETARARTLLTDGVGKLRKTGSASFFLGSESLSTACIRQGDLAYGRAIWKPPAGCWSRHLEKGFKRLFSRVIH